MSENEKRRVLIVDDDESQRSAMAHLLTGWGYQPLTAKDGLDALEKLAVMIERILNSTPSGVAVPANAEQERKYEQRRA